MTQQTDNLPITLEGIPPAEVFKPSKMDEILAGIKAHVDSFVPDLTTKKGRDEVVSLAYKVAQSKTAIDNLGKDLTAGKREEIKLIDVERKKARDFLDQLRDDTRKPVTDWEAAEERRMAKIMEGIDKIKFLGMVDGFTAEQMQHNLDQLLAVELTEEVFQDALDQAQYVAANTVGTLEAKLFEQKKYEADQAELEALRKEKAEREYAEAQAKLEAERKAEEERLRAEGEAKAKAEAAERETKLKAQKKKAQDDAKAAKARAKKEKAEAEQRAKEAAEKARQEERARLVREEEERKAAAAARKAQDDHRNKVHQEACQAIVRLGDITKAEAMTIIAAISNGQVPHITIKY